MTEITDEAYYAERLKLANQLREEFFPLKKVDTSLQNLTAIELINFLDPIEPNPYYTKVEISEYIAEAKRRLIEIKNPPGENPEKSF